MRLAWTMLCLLLPGAAAAQTAMPAVAKPLTYALVSAVGDKFDVVSEKPNVGSHLEYYRRNRLDAYGNILNRLVLQDLNQSVAATDPDSVRVFMSMPLPNTEGVPAEEREQFTIAAILGELQTHEQERKGWDRMIVVTPAYRAQEKNGMASKLQGMGVFIQSLCQTDVESCDLSVPALGGPQAITPEGEPVVANTFIAPYTYIVVWEIDPATMGIVRKTRVFNDQKISDPHLSPRNIDQRVVAGQMIRLIGASIHDGLKRAGLTGKVEVREVKAIPAPEETK
jgi:hypothetical protein